MITARSRDIISPRQSAYFLSMASIWLRSRLIFHRNLFLVWLLQHYIMPSFLVVWKITWLMGLATRFTAKLVCSSQNMPTYGMVLKEI